MIIDELKKPRISMDLFSDRGQYLSTRQIHPLPEQITAVVEGCLLAMDKLGEAGKMIEAIKISFFQDQSADYLQAKLTIYMVEQWTSTASSREKFKVEACIYAKELRHAPDSFNPGQIANNVLINIASTITSRVAVYEEKAQKANNLLLKELAPYV